MAKLKTRIFATTLFVVGISSFSNPGFSLEVESPKAKAAAEHLLEFAGGRDAWKDVKAIRGLSVIHFPGQELPALIEIFINFEKPERMIRIMNQDLDRLRGYLGDSGWGVKEAGGGGYSTYTFDEQRLVQEHYEWEGAFARNVWRVAINDPTLVLKMNEKGQLEFHNTGGNLVSWFEFGENGDPVRFGLPFDEAGIDLAVFSDFGGRHLPGVGGASSGAPFETIYVRAFTHPLEIPKNPPEDLSAFNPK